MEIKYNTPIEVTQTQYNFLMNHLKGCLAGKIENGKYFIKVWLMYSVNAVKTILNTVK